jgi:hypothetical protein
MFAQQGAAVMTINFSVLSGENDAILEDLLQSRDSKAEFRYSQIRFPPPIPFILSFG